MSSSARRGGSPSGRVGRLADVPAVTCHDRRVSDLHHLQARVRDFAEERDWQQFHDPKSLILALVGEVGELAELFQWLPAGDAAAVVSSDEALQRRAGEEVADVLIYLVRLADVLGVDLAAETAAKLSEAAVRFPADEVRGVAPTK